MMWHRDSPGDPPSPDPAAAAERYFYEQTLGYPPENEVCPECHGTGVSSVLSDHDARCDGTEQDCAHFGCPVEIPVDCEACGPTTTQVLSSIAMAVCNGEDDEEVPF